MRLPHRSPCRATSISGKVLGGGRKPVCYLSFLPLWSHTHTHTYMYIYASHASSLMENRVQAHGYFIHQWLQYEV